MLPETAPIFNGPPSPIPLGIVHLEALAADLAARGIIADAAAVLHHIRRKIVSRPLPAGAGEGGDHARLR